MSGKSFRSGFVTVIGVPNAGKSSLVNALVKESVSIVTAKPQTTRKRTLGILTDPEKYQIVFVDTPGVIESDAGLNKFLKHELAEALKDVDVIVAAIAPWEFESDEMPWVLKKRDEIFAKSKSEPVFIATQSDKFRDNKAFQEKKKKNWDAWTGGEGKLRLLETSSKSGAGLPGLREAILERLPEGPKYYDVDIFTPQTMREIATEVIRKHCFELLHQEIPYGLAVMIQTFEEGRMLKVEADIIVAKEGHKMIVIGRGGGLLKEIGTKSRRDLERLFGRKMFLKLHVVAKPQWLKDARYLEELGYAAKQD